jgi:hypothetical protein
MRTITCEIAVRRASEQLIDLLPAEERIVLEEHFASCGQCSRLMDQLRTTIAVLRNRPGLDVPDVLRELVADADDSRSADLVRHLPQLYSLAVALDPAMHAWRSWVAAERSAAGRATRRVRRHHDAEIDGKQRRPSPWPHGDEGVRQDHLASRLADQGADQGLRRARRAQKTSRFGGVTEKEAS